MLHFFRKFWSRTIVDQLTDRELIERQKEHFNSVADQYKEARSHENHLYIKQLIWENCLKDLSLPNRETYRLLEPMCGFAEGRTLIPKHMGINIDYAGFDYSDTVIALLKEQSGDINVWQGDATTWQPEDAQYDIIILIGGLHHVPNHAGKVVENLSSGLREGGIFINYEPTHGNPLTKFVRKKIYEKNSLFDEETERDFSVQELKGFFQSAGLSPMRLSYPGLLSYILFYNPDAFPFLNKGGKWLVKTTFNLDKLIYKTWLGAFLSFATLSIWEKNENK